MKTITIDMEETHDLDPAYMPQLLPEILSCLRDKESRVQLMIIGTPDLMPKDKSYEERDRVSRPLGVRLRSLLEPFEGPGEKSHVISIAFHKESISSPVFIAVIQKSAVPK